MKSTMVKETTLPFAALLLLFFVSTGSSVHMVAKKTTSWHNKARYACTTWLYVYLNLSNKFERRQLGQSKYIYLYIYYIYKYIHVGGAEYSSGTAHILLLAA
jgi:hypothetical protein